MTAPRPALLCILDGWGWRTDIEDNAIAQGTTPWATSDWAETLEHLGKPGAHVEVLRRGYRVPAAVIEFAGRLLPHMAPGIDPPTVIIRGSAAFGAVEIEN